MASQTREQVTHISRARYRCRTRPPPSAYRRVASGLGHDRAVTIPQRLTFVTLGARSVEQLRSFYRAWGWVENDGGTSDYASFTAGTVRLALYPIDRLRDEAAPGDELPEVGRWNGVTLAINFDRREGVDVAVHTALAAGATLADPPTEREWGGYSAYVADPEGARWELAWAPDFDPGTLP